MDVDKPGTLVPPQQQPAQKHTLLEFERAVPTTKREYAGFEFGSNAGFWEQKNYGLCLFCRLQISSLQGPYDSSAIQAQLIAQVSSCYLSHSRTVARAAGNTCALARIPVEHAEYDDDDDNDEDDRVCNEKPEVTDGVSMYYCSEECWYLDMLIRRGPDHAYMQLVHKLKPNFQMEIIKQCHPEKYELFTSLADSAGKRFDALNDSAYNSHTSFQSVVQAMLERK
jgi:hypothetical protein